MKYLALLFLTLSAVAQPAPDAFFVSPDGVRLYARVAGTATPEVPVVFLHGGPGYNSYSFAAQAGPLLEPHATMVYFDQRGCGYSERPASGAYSMDLLIEDVEALRRHLGVERIVPMGHSFGGTLALEYAARYPEHTARVVLVGPLSDAPASVASWMDRLRTWHPEVAPPPDSALARGDLNAIFAALEQAGGQRFFDRMQFHDLRHHAVQARLDSLSGLQNTGELGGALWGSGLMQYRFSAHERLTMPVLIVGGPFDYAIGAATMEALAARLPDARLVLLERSAHFPYAEQPADFEAAVAAFITQR